MKQLSLWYQKPPWMSSALSERSASASADTIPSCWLAYPRHGSGSNTTNRAARSPAARYYRYPAPAVHFCAWSRRVPQNPPPRTSLLSLTCENLGVHAGVAAPARSTLPGLVRMVETLGCAVATRLRHSGHQLRGFAGFSSR
jgi:hypothetical protein